ncbi:MAG TPA: trypsin-like peptidase domain-containing protein [Urbifossiella sp.]
MRFLSGLLASLVLIAPHPGLADQPTRDDLLKFEKRLKAAHANVGPAIACVVVSRSDKYPRPERTPETGQLGGFDREAYLKANPGKNDLADQLDLSKPESIPDHGFAGGVVIDSSGLVLTNYSTIDGAAKIFIHLPGGKGSYADIHAADSRSDLAVVKLLTPPAEMKAVRFGRVRFPEEPGDDRATVAPGNLALLMAYPYASGAVMDQPTGSLATIATIRHPSSKIDSSALFRSIYNYAPMVEYEARSNPGASGVPLLNLDGEVIAFTATAAAIPGGDVGLHYALPADDNVQRIIDVLRRGEEVEYGFLGVVRPSFQHQGRGIPIEGFPTPGSPAAGAQLMPNDVSRRINDHPVNTFEDLLLYIGSGLAGGKVKLRIERGGAPPRDVTVTLAKFKNEMPYIATVRPEPVFGLRVDYASVIIQSLLFIPFGGGRNVVEIPRGVHVRELIPESPAAAKFKTLGENNRWIITHLNDASVASPAEFYKAARGRKSLKLTIIDPTIAGSRHTITLP